MRFSIQKTSKVFSDKSATFDCSINDWGQLTSIQLSFDSEEKCDAFVDAASAAMNVRKCDAFRCDRSTSCLTPSPDRLAPRDI
ncbi:hypothetical protein ACN8ZM_40305 (plasmid) [Burkholderia aenigmatica]|uniref:hypothetical protein n=1 Tax=Burkholderia aenigmatica TaxID=2015348 RepID=UPI003B433BC1